jgi:hypothetical protein
MELATLRYLEQVPSVSGNSDEPASVGMQDVVNAESSNKLEVFLNRNIQRILQVLMTKVREDCIWNEHVRQMFYDIPRVSNMIAARQLDFIGKTMRGPFDRPAQQMLTECCDNV